ncbi:GNAT family N-acetyltransferase [Haloferula sp. BvORR071]|uniref:GNAT family N-acetyltransferase n=1 Tax=Haloferula sp. BvORR071 TaxID=1396141 RepID=UPI00055112EF|nr:GNAT family N-acetyltransferase [Haloferula sp. BvORR071]
MPIHYSTDVVITADQYIDLLHRADFAQRRPVDDRECITGMLQHANILCTAWDSEKLVGAARSVTDFHYCCYLSDLAVDVEYQKQGIGREMIRHTRTLLGPRTSLILLAAPAAREYYPKIGFETHPSAWVIAPGKDLV